MSECSQNILAVLSVLIATIDEHRVVVQTTVCQRRQQTCSCYSPLLFRLSSLVSINLVSTTIGVVSWQMQMLHNVDGKTTKHSKQCTKLSGHQKSEGTHLLSSHCICPSAPACAWAAAALAAYAAAFAASSFSRADATSCSRTKILSD